MKVLLTLFVIIAFIVIIITIVQKLQKKKEPTVEKPVDDSSDTDDLSVFDDNDSNGG